MPWDARRSPASSIRLEEVRDAVIRDWKAAKALEIRELHYNRLREQYVVEILRADTGTAENQ